MLDEAQARRLAAQIMETFLGRHPPQAMLSPLSDKDDET
jgi:hypothetical protein